MNKIDDETKKNVILAEEIGLKVIEAYKKGGRMCRYLGWQRGWIPDHPDMIKVNEFLKEDK